MATRLGRQDILPTIGQASLHCGQLLSTASWNLWPRQIVHHLGLVTVTMSAMKAWLKNITLNKNIHKYYINICMSNCYNLYHDWTLSLNACLRRLYMISVSLPVEVRLARPNRIASAMILAILFSDGRWRPILMHLCTNWLSLPYWPPHTNTCAKSLYTVYRDIAGVCANRFCTNWERY